jgi:DNA-binding transcriptional ArsR family regulator
MHSTQHERLAELCKAMSLAQRLRILEYLAQHGSANGVTLQGPTGLSQPVTSHHLKILVKCGLVTVTGAPGGEKTYRLADDGVKAMLKRMHQFADELPAPAPEPGPAT